MKPTKILVVSPASCRYDATLHYYQAEFSAVVSHLRVQFPTSSIEALPCGLSGAPEKVLIGKILKRPDFIVIWCRVWEAKAAMRTAEEAKAISPASRILFWGDAVHFMPQYFRRQPIDGYVNSGDPEAVLSDAIRAMACSDSPAPGLAIANHGWREPAPGRWLPPSQWPFPALDVIDFADYRQAREFRGKPTDDLSFYVSRGCAVGCEWCSAPLKEGRIDRRRPVAQTVDYMRRGLKSFQLYQMHSPMFMQDHHWCADFIHEMRRQGLCIPFKVVTLQRHLEDGDLVAALASVGLRSVGFGIETLTADKQRRQLTGKVKEERLELVRQNLEKAGVKGKAYVQIGLPGQGRDDILYTIETMHRLGFNVRATGATPFQRLRTIPVEELDRMDLSRWDRKSFFEPSCGLSYAEFHQVLVDPAGFQSEPLIRKEAAVCALV